MVAAVGSVSNMHYTTALHTISPVFVHHIIANNYLSLIKYQSDINIDESIMCTMVFKRINQHYEWENGHVTILLIIFI